MEKLINTVFMLLLIWASSFNAMSQEEDQSLDVYIIRNITPENNVESYLEVRDSIFAVMEYLNEQWGESKQDNGKVCWNNVKIDSIQGSVNVTMLYGISKGEMAPLKVSTIPKKEISHDKHVLRFRFLQKDKDLLSSSATQKLLKDYFLNILASLSINGQNEDNESE